MLQQEADPCRRSEPTASTVFAAAGSTSAGTVGSISASTIKVTYSEPNFSLIDLAMEMYFMTLSRLAWYEVIHF